MKRYRVIQVPVTNVAKDPSPTSLAIEQAQCVITGPIFTDEEAALKHADKLAETYLYYAFFIYETTYVVAAAKTPVTRTEIR
jgi:hypothetical protein